MIKAFLGAITLLLAAAGSVSEPVSRPRPMPVQLPSTHALEGASSTPAVFALPQVGSAGFRCDAHWSVEPFFDMHHVSATDAVTILAGGVTRRNFTRKVVGRVHGRPLIEEEFSRAQELALPFGHYRRVVFRVRQGTEAREIDATLTADFGPCYVSRWSVRMDVRPY